MANKTPTLRAARNGFTALELLIVITLTGILLAVFIGAKRAEERKIKEAQRQELQKLAIVIPDSIFKISYGPFGTTDLPREDPAFFCQVINPHDHTLVFKPTDIIIVRHRGPIHPIPFPLEIESTTSFDGTLISGREKQIFELKPQEIIRIRLVLSEESDSDDSDPWSQDEVRNVYHSISVIGFRPEFFTIKIQFAGLAVLLIKLYPSLF